MASPPGTQSFSVATRLWGWQKAALAGLGGALLAPETTLAVLLAVMAVPFLCVVVLRSAALWNLIAPPAPAVEPPPVRIDAELLPLYSVLVPLYREASVVPAPHCRADGDRLSGRALAALMAEPGQLGCRQARLNIYNSRTSWLTRQFTIEYTALFDCILPTLERFELPVPLGGTSNHFRRDVLDAVVGWDPYNVHEDADPGIRLARAGWHVGILGSTTWEEAPPTFRIWLGQRKRWLKGWMRPVKKTLYSRRINGLAGSWLRRLVPIATMSQQVQWQDQSAKWGEADVTR